MNLVPFAGWKRNAQIVCNDIEMIVTLEVGPRVLFYGPTGGPNFFAVHEADGGKTGGDKFNSFGGHRLWIAPEEPLRTLRPDNEPVEYTMDGQFHVFTSPCDEYHTQKQIRIQSDPVNNRFVLIHRIYNHGAYPIELAAWTPTQCAGGSVLFPHAPFESHSDRLLPTRPIVMWGYTRFQDSRWTWGDRIVRLKHDPTMSPQKAGSLVEQGYAACVNEGTVYLKRFGFNPKATYPDFNCNFETFTNEHMIEIESLGPVVTVGCGDYTEHQETWYLIPNQTVPEDDDACADWLAELAANHPF